MMKNIDVSKKAIMKFFSKCGFYSETLLAQRLIDENVIPTKNVDGLYETAISDDEKSRDSSDTILAAPVWTFMQMADDIEYAPNDDRHDLKKLSAYDDSPTFESEKHVVTIINLRLFLESTGIKMHETSSLDWEHVFLKGPAPCVWIYNDDRNVLRKVLLSGYEIALLGPPKEKGKVFPELR
jgi:hypothetical protein